MIRLGLLGYPLEHSLSPGLHRVALAEAGLDGDYALFPIAPEAGFQDQLQPLLQDLRTGRLQGLNVTIPYKQAVIPFLDELTPVASRIGSVNTIYSQGGRLVGDNTDAAGFYLDLCHTLHFNPREWASASSALVLGAGGAARAVVYALASHGWDVWVAARRRSQAEALIADLKRSLDAIHLAAGDRKRTLPDSDEAATPAGGIQALDWHSPLPQELRRGIRLIVNATPLGMAPQLGLSPWPPGEPWPEQACVYDLVYNPPITLLVRVVRAAGLPAVSGGGMLVEQAALAFELWTGMPVARRLMRQELDRLLAAADPQ